MSYTRYLFQVCIGVCSSRSLMEFPLKSKSFALWEYGVVWRTLALGLSRLSSAHGYSQCCRFLPCHSLRGENVHHISMFTFHCVSCRFIGCGIVKNALDNILYNMKQIASMIFCFQCRTFFLFCLIHIATLHKEWYASRASNGCHLVLLLICLYPQAVAHTPCWDIIVCCAASHVASLLWPNEPWLQVARTADSIACVL